jgi:predicted transcriptional regulator
MVVTLDPATADKLASIAFADRVSRSSVIDEAVASYFEKKEAERGEPYPRR